MTPWEFRQVYDDMLKRRFDTISERDRQKDGQNCYRIVRQHCCYDA